MTRRGHVVKTFRETRGFQNFHQFFDLFAEDSWRSVYVGELEVRPPGAPTMENLGAARLRD
jgi:hypothetical protein